MDVKIQNFFHVQNDQGIFTSQSKYARTLRAVQITKWQAHFYSNGSKAELSIYDGSEL